MTLASRSEKRFRNGPTFTVTSIFPQTVSLRPTSDVGFCFFQSRTVVVG
jgi:hypothetical protein